VTAAAGESNMGGGQVPRKGKRGLLLFIFSTASNDIDCLGRALISVGIADRKVGHAN
jgi:hypothetical protein